MFQDRRSAGQSLAIALEKIVTHECVVLGIPRGGMLVAKVIADHLEAPLDMVLVKKISSPHNSELAVGAVSEIGEVILNEWALGEGIKERQLKAEVKKITEALQTRRKFYSAGRPAAVDNKCVILVDDGIATGATVRAALHFIKKKHPRQIILATPVCPPDTLRKLQNLVDNTVVLAIPREFSSVGEFYWDFPQISDSEIASVFSEKENLVEQHQQTASHNH